MFSLKFLHGDRVPRAHQHVAAMLEQRVHRHDEEARARADATIMNTASGM
jgi:hypothetical protein